MTYLIDTAAAVEKIEQSGLSRQQAEAIVSTIAETGDQVATKTDIDHLQTAIGNLGENMKTQITLRALAVGGVMVALLKALEYLGV